MLLWIKGLKDNSSLADLILSTSLNQFNIWLSLVFHLMISFNFLFLRCMSTGTFSTNLNI